MFGKVSAETRTAAEISMTENRSIIVYCIGFYLSMEVVLQSWTVSVSRISFYDPKGGSVKISSGCGEFLLKKCA